MYNNLFLTAACSSVFVGTLYPLALEALTAEKISVGAPFFNLTFGPLFVPLMLAAPFGPLLAWKRGDLLGAARQLAARECFEHERSNESVAEQGNLFGFVVHEPERTLLQAW